MTDSRSSALTASMFSAKKTHRINNKEGGGERRLSEQDETPADWLKRTVRTVLRASTVSQ